MVCTILKLPAELQCAVQNVFVTCDACLTAEGNYFPHLLYIWQVRT